MLNSSKWFLFCVGRGGHLLVSCVPMREQTKRREKVLFSSWALRSAVIFEKCYFCRKMVCVLQILGLQEVAEVRG